MEAQEQPLCFRIAEVQGKGLGAIATRDIARGEVVLAERPAIDCRGEYPDETWRAALKEEFDRLPSEVQEQVMALYDALVLSEQKTLEGIVFSNAIGRQQARFDVALLLMVSRFNHSCIPNLEQSWDELSGQAHLIAAQDVREGEELFSCYVELRASKDERAQKLWETYRFRCNCPACQTGDDASDQRRQRMMGLNKELSALGTKDPARGLKMVSSLLELYDKEGLHLNSHRKWNCYSAAEFSILLGDNLGAHRWARRALAYSRLAHGDGHKDTKWLGEFVKDPSRHPSSRSFRDAAGMTVVPAAIVMVGFTVLGSIRFF